MELFRDRKLSLKVENTKKKSSFFYPAEMTNKNRDSKNYSQYD